MKTTIVVILTLLLFNTDSFTSTISGGNNCARINDGPYIYQVNNKLKAQWVEDGVYRQELISPVNFHKLKETFRFSFDYRDLTDTWRLEPRHNHNYIGADSISVISDLHGNYGAYTDLLRGAGVIDENLNWNFGKGHLVVLGDIFDRGRMVTEILWHLFGLEKQAAKAGGKVHIVLGNHEFMVLQNNLCNINEKYRKVEEICGSCYADFFSGETVLGRWLRSKPVVITINDIIFVHGGISSGLIQRKIKINQINTTLNRMLNAGSFKENYDDEKILKFMNGADGPLWFRGYFDASEYSEVRIDSVLSFYNKKHIVVGHTPGRETRSLFNNKILGVDTGIMFDRPGEMLIYKKGSFYKSCPAGRRIRL